MYEFSGTQTYLLCFHLVFLFYWWYLHCVFVSVCVSVSCMFSFFYFIFFSFLCFFSFFLFDYLHFTFSLTLCFSPFCFPSATLLTSFLVAFYYCMSTVAFIFGAFYMPYKTIQTILLWELFVFTGVTASVFLAHLYCFFLISFHFAQLGLLGFTVQNSVKSTNWVQILTLT